MALLLLEVLVRIVDPQRLVQRPSDIYMAIDDGIGYRLRGNIDTMLNIAEGEARLITDEYGHRVGEARSENPAYRILALGDSFLEALHVNYEDTITARLERSVSASLAKSVRITNTGVAGYDPNHYLKVARRELARQDYDLIIVFVYVANDVITTPIDVFPPREPTLRHHLRLPRAFSKVEIKAGILYPINDFLAETSQLYVLAKHSGDLFLARLGLTTAYFPDVVQTSSKNAPKWAVTANRLAEIAALRGALGHPPRVMYVLLPATFQVDEEELDWYIRAFRVDRDTVDLTQPSEILVRELGARGLTVFDALPALRDAHRRGVGRLYGRTHKHFEVHGHAVVAEYLRRFVLRYLRCMDIGEGGSCDTNDSRLLSRSSDPQQTDYQQR